MSIARSSTVVFLTLFASAAGIALAASGPAQTSVTVQKTSSSASSAIHTDTVPVQVASAQVRIPILVYHHIRSAKPYPKSTWSYKMSVSPDVFRTQLQWMQDHGYTTVTLDKAAAILAGTESGPEKPVVITFDDNQRTQFTIAYPELVNRRMTGVFYLVTNRLKNRSFILEQEAKKMSDDGMDIQSHTITHSTLTALSLKRLDQELRESRATLEAITGKPVRHVAYPSTAQNKTVREHAASAGYVTATIMDPRTATPKDDVLKLPRIMMTDDTDLKRVLP